MKVLTVFVLLCGCGQRSVPTPTDNPDNQNLDLVCQSDAQCGDGGRCIGGRCVDAGAAAPAGAAVCLDDPECAAGEFCHFTAVWEPGDAGYCDASCGECAFGELCYAGQCYTLQPCDPALRSVDCPPGEACNPTTRACSPPPEHCYFDSQCPAGWTCNVDGVCIDPNVASAGACNRDEDCSAYAECADGCVCVEHECVAEDSCRTRADCPAGQRCVAGSCIDARACSSQDDCTPFGLVCEDGHCVDPIPCADGCPAGYICIETATPPGCFPEGTGACVRDEQCPAGQYCNLFTESCDPGCRGDGDCVGACPGSAICSCTHTHTCAPVSTGTVGDPCVADAGCPGGTVCAYNDPTAALPCGMVGEMPGINCSQSCHQVCDLLTSAVLDTCPAGQTCGGEDALTTVVMGLFEALFTGNDHGSVCY
jgi:hypothetical protein